MRGTDPRAPLRGEGFSRRNITVSLSAGLLLASAATNAPARAATPMEKRRMPDTMINSGGIDTQRLAMLDS